MLTFRPDCTLPVPLPQSPSQAIYVSATPLRSTLSILYSTLSVLLLCLWNVVHINVHAPLHPSPAYSGPWFASRLRTVALKVQWMGLGFLAPEVLIAKALHDRVIVGESVRVMGEWARRDGVRWTETHAHWANMGAFGVVFDEVEEVGNGEGTGEGMGPSGVCVPEVAMSERSEEATRPVQAAETVPVERPAESTAQHGEAEVTTHLQDGKAPATSTSVKEDVELAKSTSLEDSFGRQLKTISARYGKEIWQKSDINHARAAQALETLKKVGIASIRLRARQRNALALQGNLWILDAAQIQVARSFGNGENPLLNLPDVHEEHLESESKSDPLLKLLTVTQILWLVVQLIVRLYRHLPTSLLEIMTFSFAVCSVVTYIALLEKPKDLALMKTIRARRYPTADELLDIALAGPSTLFGYREGYWMPNNIIHHIGNSSTMATADLTIQQKIQRLDKVASFSRVVFIATGCIGSVVFGSLHFISWDFHFPTPLERLLWRIAICVTVGLPVCGALAQGLFAQLFQQGKQRGNEKPQPENYQRVYLRVTAWLISVMAALYLIVRLFVLVEVFRSLAYLPLEAYRTTWSANLPHVG